MRRSQHSRRGGFGLLLLGSQIMRIGVQHIPPVTLGTLALNVAIFLRLIPGLPSISDACTSNVYVVKNKQWKRLLLSSFYHSDDMHLYFNMVSLIWKGKRLENKLKSKRFFILLAIFSILTQVVMLMLNYTLATVFVNKSYLHSCAAGFSAVLFALKVLTTYYSEDNVSIMGLPIMVPSRYACWVELILIQIIVPNVSFTGHLAGILVGLLYVRGPLKKIIKGIDRLSEGHYLPQYPQFQQTNNYASRVNQRSNETNNGVDEEEEEMQRAIQNSLDTYRYNSPSSYTSSPPSYGWNLNGPTQPTSTQPTAPSFHEHSDNSTYPTSYDYAPYPLAYPDLPPSYQETPPTYQDTSSTYQDTPYPLTFKNPPYPSRGEDDDRSDNSYSNDLPSNSQTRLMGRNELNDNEMRSARLRRFAK